MTQVSKLTGVTFTDATLPLLYRDSMINPGTLACFDFKNPYCWPTGVVPAAGTAVPNGTVFNNLVPGGPTLTVSGSTMTYNGTGGLVFDSSTTLSLGNNYNFATTNANFAIYTWYKQSAAANTYGQYVGRSTNGNAPNCQYRFDYGNGGLSPRLTVGGATSTTTVNTSGAGSLNTVYQYCGTRVGTQVSFYRNGLQTQTSTMTDTTLANPTISNMVLGGDVFKGAIYRLVIEDLTVSGKNALSQVQADYAANASRFS